MYRHILLCTDGSDLAMEGANHGIALAKSLNAKVTCVTVTAPYHAVVIAPDAAQQIESNLAEVHGQQMRALASSYLAGAREAADAAGVPCDTVHAEHARPHAAILDVARSRGCDLIVMASHGRGGLAAMVLGSETLKVLTHGTTPVVVVPPPKPAAYFAAS